jgi:phosphoglycolate phosphatase-like HAD superfamily hydrolase
MTTPVLPSWRDGQARSAVTSFLDAADQIPPALRVAVFDNDGTLWCEKPNYPQVDFLVSQLRRAVEVDPKLSERAEYRAILDGDDQTLNAMGLPRIVTSLLDLYVGISPEEFDDEVASFFAQQVHPDRGVPYRQLRYQPMLELLGELKDRDFGIYIVSGGGAEFVRVIGQDFYGVSPEGVVGSQIDYEVTRSDSGAIGLARTNHVEAGGPNEGEAKVSNIQRILGRRPVVAGGNSAGDAEMLEFATSYEGPALALLVNHDDAEREYAYESKAGTFDADEAILDTAARLNWTVVSMKDDWSTVFAV